MELAVSKSGAMTAVLDSETSMYDLHQVLNFTTTWDLGQNNAIVILI